MVCLSLGMAQEVEPIHTRGLHLGWLESLTNAVCGMKFATTVSASPLAFTFQSFTSSFCTFCCSRHSPCHVRQNKRHHLKLRKLPHSTHFLSTVFFTDRSWAHCMLSADSLQEGVSQRSSQRTSPVG